MATTAQKTDLQVNTAAAPPVLNKRSKGGSEHVTQMAVHTQSGAGDDPSTVDIATVPGGSRIDMHASSIRFTAFGAARVMKMGWRAYTKPDGTVVAADDDGLFAALDVAAAGYKQWVEAPTLGAGLDTDDTRLFEGPAVLFATVTGGTWPDAARTVYRICYGQSD